MNVVLTDTGRRLIGRLMWPYTMTAVDPKHHGETYRDEDFGSIWEATSAAMEWDRRGWWTCILGPDGEPLGDDDVVERYRKKYGPPRG